MKSQKAKDVFHATAGQLSILNRWRLQLLPGALRSRRPDGLVWVHLGSGSHPIDGMINVDVNPFNKPDVWLNILKGLPFRDASVDAIYCCHTLEHFKEGDVRRILRDCRRILKPGSGIRIVTPDLRKAAQAYLAGDASYFSDFPDRRTSLGGRFANYLLCRDQHRLIFDFSFWAELLEAEGFGSIRERVPHDSDVFPREELAVFEYEQPARHHSVFVEASRPAPDRVSME